MMMGGMQPPRQVPAVLKLLTRLGFLNTFVKGEGLRKKKGKSRGRVYGEVEWSAVVLKFKQH